MKEINIGVMGGTGYTGGELCRLLLNHPKIGNIFPTSRESEDFERVHPNLAGSNLKFVSPENLEAIANTLDVVFFCTPTGEAMKSAPSFLEEGVKVIDLSADFRFKDPEQFERVYGKKHSSTELLGEAVYGVTEFGRVPIKNARLVANPGCYVITALLGLYPLLKEKLIELGNIPINAVNGTTGASYKPEKGTMHAGVFGNMLSYNMEGHRHSGELEDQIRGITGEEPMVNLNTAHGNFARGIHLVASPIIIEGLKNQMSRQQLLNIYQESYAHEPFVRVVTSEKRKKGTTKEYDIYPQIRNVTGTNFCDIGLDYDPKRGIIKVIAVTDNLVKGAAGSAIQNMNVMFGFDEKEGLRQYGP